MPPNPIVLAPNGVIHIANFPCNEQGEFPPNWTTELSFVRAPETLCVRWTHGPVPSATWELIDTSAEPDKKVASGPVPAATLDAPKTVFEIKVQPSVPVFNKTSEAVRYIVRVTFKNPRTSETERSTAGRLVHLPRPAAANPFDCKSAPPNSARKVVIAIPRMTVNQTSNTSGDGDRDELYIRVSRLGPGVQSTETRLPSLDDYYEAKNTAEVLPNGWTNKDQRHVDHPVIWTGTLAHGQNVLIGITAAEQDNADLADIKDGLVKAMQAVAAIAASTGTPYGAVVAAVAGAIAVGSQTFIPSTKNHDFVGFVMLKITNQCGFIQTAWVTYKSLDSPAGKIGNDFMDLQDLESVESRLAVLDPAPPQFWPDGVDWTPYAHVGKADQFWWRATGTSNSKYTFLLRTSAEMVP